MKPKSFLCNWPRATLVLCAMLAPALAGCNYELYFPKLDTVDRVDVARYVGVWYEIARYPNAFEQGCVGVTAQYTLNADGSVKVINTCRPDSLDAAPTTIEGRAQIADTTSNAKLNVSFFGPFGAPYWIIDLDPDYQWAVVGEPSRSFLWILSRTPTLDEALYQDILSRLPEKGYDASRLVPTPQK